MMLRYAPAIFRPDLMPTRRLSTPPRCHDEVYRLLLIRHHEFDTPLILFCYHSLFFTHAYDYVDNIYYFPRPRAYCRRLRDILPSRLPCRHIFMLPDATASPLLRSLSLYATPLFFFFRLLFAMLLHVTVSQCRGHVRVKWSFSFRH